MVTTRRSVAQGSGGSENEEEMLGRRRSAALSTPKQSPATGSRSLRTPPPLRPRPRLVTAEGSEVDSTEEGNEEEDEEREEQSRTPSSVRRRQARRASLPGRRLEVETEAEAEVEEGKDQQEEADEAKRKRAQYATQLAILPEGDWYGGEGPQCTLAGPPGYDEAAALEELRERGLPLFMPFGKYKGLGLKALRRLADGRHYVSYFMTQAGFFDQFCAIDENMALLEALHTLRMLCFVRNKYNQQVRVADMLQAYKQTVAQGGKRQRVGTGVMRVVGGITTR